MLYAVCCMLYVVCCVRCYVRVNDHLYTDLRHQPPEERMRKFSINTREQTSVWCMVYGVWCMVYEVSRCKCECLVGHTRFVDIIRDFFTSYEARELF